MSKNQRKKETEKKPERINKKILNEKQKKFPIDLRFHAQDKVNDK